jgi:hypothetical protein
MRGRKASAALAVDRAAGSATAKQRAKAIYQVLSGQCSIAQACAALGVSEPRFHQLKEQLVQGSVAALEPRPAGRPAQAATPEQAQIAALEHQLQTTRLELGVAQTREEIALVLPHVVQTPPATGRTPPEKKTRPRPRQRRSRSRLAGS